MADFFTALMAINALVSLAWGTYCGPVCRDYAAGAYFIGMCCASLATAILAQVWS